MDNHTNYTIKISITLLSILLVSSSALALGISTPYYPSNPLKLSPGETREVSFTLVNGINEKSTKAIINLEQTDGIAELISPRELQIEPGSKNKKVTFKITISQDANIGDTYEIRFSVGSSQTQKGDTIEIGVGYIVSFPVEVVSQEDISPEPKPAQILPSLPSTPPKAETKSIANTIIPIAAILIILVLIFIWLSKRKKQV